MNSDDRKRSPGGYKGEPDQYRDIVIANTLRIAAQDLEAARLLKGAGHRSAVYHCEQAAEKVIKAVMTAESLHTGIRHDLDEWVDRIPDENPLKPSLRAIEHLAAFATTTRYVTTKGRISPAPGPDAVAGYIADIEVALNAAAAAFQVDLAAADTPARNSTPPRRPQ